MFRAPTTRCSPSTTTRPLILCASIRCAASLVALCCALSFAWLDTPWSIALSLALYSAAWNGVMSVYDAHVLQRTGADSGRYGTLRLWGSIGFIVLAATAGRFLDLAGLDALPWLLAGLIVMTWTTLRGPEPEPARPPDERPLQFRALVADRRVRVFLLVAFLMIASHGAYYNFLSIHLAAVEHGDDVRVVQMFHEREEGAADGGGVGHADDAHARTVDLVDRADRRARRHQIGADE